LTDKQCWQDWRGFRL